MKKALLLFFVTLSVLSSVNAQWYERTCGVPDLTSLTTQEFECLWANAAKTSRAGGIITGIGTSFIVVGGIIVGANSSFTGVTLAMIGIVIDVFIGAPVWITGAGRKSELRETPYFETHNLQTLNISPIIYKNQVNNSYSLGITASLRF